MAFPKLILMRGTHYLVVSPFSEYNQAVREKISRVTTITEKSTVSGKYYPVFNGTLLEKRDDGLTALRIPRNVSIELVTATWPEHKLIKNPPTQDAPRLETPVRFLTSKFPVKSPEQQSLITFLEKNQPSALIEASTAVGKSYASIMWWCSTRLRGMVVFAQSVHLQNYYKELLKFTDLTDDEICVIKGRATLEQFIATPEKFSRVKIFLGIHRTFSKSLSADIESQETSPIFTNPANPAAVFLRTAGIGVMIYDECHLEIRSLTHLNLLSNAPYSLLMTATADRTEWTQKSLFNAVIPRLASKVVKTAARIDVVNIPFDSKPDAKTIRTCYNSSRECFEPNAFFEYLINSRQRMFIDALASTIQLAISNHPEGSSYSVAVVMSGRLVELQALVRLLAEVFPDKRVGNFSSLTKTPEAIQFALEADIIVTTTKSFNGSINIPRMASMVLIAPIASSVLVEQISGRLRGIDGTPCRLYDLYDVGFPAISRQQNARKKLWSKLAQSVSDHTLP